MRIAIKRSDGGVSIMEVYAGAEEIKRRHKKAILAAAAAKKKAPTLKQFQESFIPEQVAKWEAGSNMTALSWREVQMNQFPDDRTFRDAWTDDNPTETVDVDMPKARTIHMDRIRETRDKELARLDIEVTKAIAQKDDARVTQLETERQTLRDIPQTFDLGQFATPEALKEAWPAEL